MGSRIEAAGIAWEAASGSIDLETRAAEDCLARAGVAATDVGLLINAGIYRDHHIVEPAISSFVQRRIGANGEYDDAHSTFSFDLSNGGCGLLTGIMVADGFLSSGLTEHALVVAGDAEPEQGQSSGYDYVAAAAAVVLTPGGDEDGFVAFHAAADTTHIDSYGGRIEWDCEREQQVHLVMRDDAAYAQECVDSAGAAVKAFLAETGLELGDVDLVIPSQSPPRFVAGLRERTGLGERVVDVTAEYGNVHTAGAGIALAGALADGRFAAARHVLFVTVGAGIATTLALYKVPR